MVSNCANPKCAKPLHYLRDGRIFVFEVQDKNATGAKRTRHIEHFWLCGACSQTMVMERSADGAHVVLRPLTRLRAAMAVTGTAMAS